MSILEKLSINSLIEKSNDANISSVKQAEDSRAFITSIAVSVIGLILKIIYPSATPLNDYIFIQMIFGNMLGFIADQIYATKEGFSLFKGGASAKGIVSTIEDNGVQKINWNIDKFSIDETTKKLTLNPGESLENLGKPLSLMSFMLKKVGSIQFIRYMITVIIDVIISTVIYSIAREYYKKNYPFSFMGFKPFKKYKDGKENKKLDLFIQFLIGFSTFAIYVNILRLSWAYQEMPEDKVTLAVTALGIGSALGYIALREPEKADFFEKLVGKIKLVSLLFILLFAHKTLITNNVLRSGHKLGGIILIAIITMASFYFAKNLKFSTEEKKESKKTKINKNTVVTEQTAETAETEQTEETEEEEKPKRNKKTKKEKKKKNNKKRKTTDNTSNETEEEVDSNEDPIDDETSDEDSDETSDEDSGDDSDETLDEDSGDDSDETSDEDSGDDSGDDSDDDSGDDSDDDSDEAKKIRSGKKSKCD